MTQPGDVHVLGIAFLLCREDSPHVGRWVHRVYPLAPPPRGPMAALRRHKKFSESNARQSIPTYRPGHRLNSGTFGYMGVGVPFGIGAKVARPESPVLVLHGDGSFGMNCMEIQTALRHNLPFVTLISNNGGWTARAADAPDRPPGYFLGFSHYELLVEALGGYGECVTSAEEIKPALRRAFESGKAACINVMTAPVAATTAGFGGYEAV